MKQKGWIFGLILGAGLAGLPFLQGGYLINFLTVLFYWIGLTGCWNYMSGYTGYIDFGSVTYVGVGAYTAGILVVKAGLPLYLAVIFSGLAALLLAVLVGWPTLKLRGAYFAIATFALAEALKQVTEEWNSLTGGGSGLTYTTRFGDQAYYWIYLSVTGLIVAMTFFTDRSKMGYALKAIHQDEHAAARVGVNTHWIKVRAYAQSAFFIGLLGSLEASRIGYITPVDVFNVNITIKMVIMSLLGGMGTVWGPIVGAGFLQTIEDFLGATFLNWYLVIIGIIIILVIMFMPRGISGTVAARLRELVDRK
jgi:branched-chain amino acid transport system permease protein